MNWLHLGLRGRLFIIVLLLLIALLASIALLVVIRAERGLTEMHHRHLEAVADQWVDAMRYAVLAKSPALIDSSLEAVVTTPDLCQIDIRDEAGQPITAWRSNDAKSCDLRVERDVFTRSVAPGANGQELDPFGVTTTPGRRVGHLTVVFSTAALTQIRKQMRFDIIVAFILLGSLGLVVVFFGASSLVRRIRQLVASADKVAHGDFDVRVEAHGTDEITQLSRAFNLMTGSLASQRQALDEAAGQLAERESLAAIGRATAVIAHELKNPLGILLGGAEIVANPNRSAAAREQAATIIQDEVRRLDRTLNDLLGYAKPRPPCARPVDALALCRTVAERATFQGGPARGLTVNVSGPPARIVADEQQVAQIILNLITNSAQAGATTISVEINRPGDRIEICCRDDGPGVPASAKEQLFRPFVTTKQRGAGLGLAGSRRLARDNGGDLRYSSAAQGATFVLDLPIAVEDETP